MVIQLSFKDTYDQLFILNQFLYPLRLGVSNGAELNRIEREPKESRIEIVIF